LTAKGAPKRRLRVPGGFGRGHGWRRRPGDAGGERGVLAAFPEASVRDARELGISRRTSFAGLSSRENIATARARLGADPPAADPQTLSFRPWK